MSRSRSNRVRWSVLLAAVVVGLGTSAAAATSQRTFPTPAAAVDALVQAVKSDDQKALSELFGSNAKDLLSSGDAVADENALKDFDHDLAERHSLEKAADDKMVLVYGDDDFPFPIPLVKKGDAWHFDAAAGRKEILARRVGRNELSTIQVCLAFVDAQREYGSKDRNGDGLFEYAQKFRSTPGKHDGLYWQTEPNEPESPLGELVADARSEGYGGKPAGSPYHGYLFKILTAQGKHAPDGAYDYMAHGRMIGGFAMVAYPYQYGNSGVNHDGEVYSKDLGPNSKKIASSMKRFDPDSTWKKEENVDEDAPKPQ